MSNKKIFTEQLNESRRYTDEMVQKSIDSGSFKEGSIEHMR